MHNPSYKILVLIFHLALNGGKVCEDGYISDIRHSKCNTENEDPFKSPSGCPVEDETFDLKINKLPPLSPFISQPQFIYGDPVFIIPIYKQIGLSSGRARDGLA
ncbi:uncharacterized protein EAE97_003620 [Botrytis byssoidea]|uniref:Uncharacterized protein n=1 Tax=Botrytis byssoidea TaxID=139641 RepID=A0A9P5LWG8_9HELO|nr:uncharacterized protein EAE97_003620 [Botrytis byssoidea]KAF7948209.1 hypothetical protein EAE97_003620 [Botrytis byssoidea]